MDVNGAMQSLRPHFSRLHINSFLQFRDVLVKKRVYYSNSIVGIFYGREIFWYFIHANSCKNYDFMCNYSSESKRVPEKKRFSSNLFYY